MSHSTSTQLISNMALLLSISAIYSILPKKSFKHKGLTSILIGCAFAIIGLCIMATPFRYVEGIVFDTRTIAISSCGLFFGLIPTLIVVCVTSLYRIIIGGSGALMGVSTIFFSAIIGLVWRYTRLKHILINKRKRFIELYLLGIVTHIMMLACMFLLPSEISFGALKSLSLPVITVFPLGSVTLGLLLLNQHDRSKITAKLAESEERYRSLFENYHTVMLLIDPISGDIVEANPAARRYYGYQRDELTQMKIWEINTLPVDKVKHEMGRVLSDENSHFYFKHRLSSGEIRDVESFSAPIIENGQRLLYSIVHDVAERKIAEQKLRESEERLKVTLLSVGDGVIATDEFGRITMVNKAAEDITGWTSEEKIGKRMSEVFNIVNEYTRIKAEDPVQKVLDTGKIIGLANHAILILEDGTEKAIADSAAPIMDENGTVKGVVLVVRDVTEERQKQREIEYLVYHDSLTELYNRTFFDEQLILADTSRNLPISIIIGDVNGLKLTNDAFGHEMGDKLLKDMAKAIRASCRGEDIVARWGGDEFIILLPNTNQAGAEKVCQAIKANCSETDMKFVDFSISLGYDTKCDMKEDIAAIIKKAEEYMYRKKAVESMSMRGNTINMIMSTLHEICPMESLHSSRVSELCKEIGMAMKLSEREISELAICGLLHDIGKIAISEAILNKNDKLTKEEYNEIRRHPAVGYRILSASNNMSYVADYVLAHHERLDGKGYPSGLIGEEVPLQSKILTVADAYDAMTSNRSYRKALSMDDAVLELKRNAGTQFDPDVVKAFIAYIHEIQCVG